MSMESDVKLMKNIMVANAVVWVVMFAIGLGSYLWAKYKAAKAEAEDEEESSSSSSSSPKTVTLSAVKL
jgi:nitrogen fixation-related uncharacterized protein